MKAKNFVARWPWIGSVFLVSIIDYRQYSLDEYLITIFSPLTLKKKHVIEWFIKCVVFVVSVIDVWLLIWFDLKAGSNNFVFGPDLDTLMTLVCQMCWWPNADVEAFSVAAAAADAVIWVIGTTHLLPLFFIYSFSTCSKHKTQT